MLVYDSGGSLKALLIFLLLFKRPKTLSPMTLFLLFLLKSFPSRSSIQPLMSTAMLTLYRRGFNPCAALSSLLRLPAARLQELVAVAPPAP